MRRLCVLLACVFAIAVPAGAGAQNALTELALGVVNPSAVEMAPFIADRQGFFREQGLHVTLVSGGSPANVVNLLASGTVAIASDSTDVMMGAISRGLPFKFIAPGFQTVPYRLVTIAAITDWSQLKGKTVLIGPKVDVTGVALRRMAEAHHLTLDDFNLIVSTNTAARFAGVSSGNAAAAMLNQPSDILAQGNGLHLLAAAHDYIKDWMFEGFAVNTAWLAANRPVAIRFVRALREAIRFGYAHPDETAAILVAATNIAPDVAKKTYDLNWRQWRAFDPNLHFDLAGMRAVAQSAVGSGILTTVPDLTTFYDDSIVADSLR